MSCGVSMSGGKYLAGVSQRRWVSKREWVSQRGGYPLDIGAGIPPFHGQNKMPVKILPSCKILFWAVAIA